MKRRPSINKYGCLLLSQIFFYIHFHLSLHLNHALIIYNSNNRSYIIAFYTNQQSAQPVSDYSLNSEIHNVLTAQSNISQTNVCSRLPMLCRGFLSHFLFFRGQLC